MYNEIIRRTTIMADEATLERLKALARDRGVSFAQVVREALEEKALSRRPRPRSLGIGQSAEGATARDVASGRQPPRSWR